MTKQLTPASQRDSDARSPRMNSDDVPRPVSGGQLDDQERWSKALTVTIDGPAGSGKSTVARLFAETLGYQYVDTGATYRALAWLALERGIPLDEADRLRGLAIAQPVMLGYELDRWTVRIAGRDVTDAIREPRIDDAASKVAKHEAVRDVLVGRQRQLSLGRDSVLDGRDCGTRVRPDADLKVFITATIEERARRRGGQYDADVSEVQSDIQRRDERDAPQSAPSSEAIEIDSTNRSVEQVLDDLVKRWLERRHELLDYEITAGRTAKDWVERDFMTSFERTSKSTGWIWRKGFRLRTHGIERVPARNCLFIANHSSMWDSAFIIMAMDRPIRYMAKVELTSLPLVNKLGDSIGMFPVRRGNGDRVALHIAESVLRRGDSLGIFPEGTRVYDGRLARPKQGAARLALITGVPIVPVAVYGTRWHESPGTVQVAFGHPHTFEGWRATPANIAKATEAVWQDVEELWVALRRGRNWR